MSLLAATCQSCGGAVVMEAGRKQPRCVFCGAEALVEGPVPEGIEPPRTYLGFQIDEEGARAAFRTFARSSIFYPGDLREAKLELQRVLVPAWVWAAELETHYTALVSASTRSGKRPVTGVERRHLDGELVIASSTLTQKELEAISPFDAEAGIPFTPEQVSCTYELGHLTRAIAQQAGEDALEARHREAIRSQLGALDLRASAVFEGLEGWPVLLPVFIGAYRRDDRFYRVVINARSGKLTGTAPLSPWRVAAAVLLVLLVVAAIAAFAMRQ